MDIAVPGQPAFRVTFSAGIAMLAEGETVDEWKKAADDALYASKAAGRNRLTGRLVPEDDGEERAVHVQAAVVLDEAHLPEPVHEEADP